MQEIVEKNKYVHLMICKNEPFTIQKYIDTTHHTLKPIQLGIS